MHADKKTEGERRARFPLVSQDYSCADSKTTYIFNHVSFTNGQSPVALGSLLSDLS